MSIIRDHVAQVRTHYDAWFRRDRRVFGAAGSVADVIDRALPLRARILDLGAGQGRHALFYARRGWDVTAVEFSHVGVEQLRAAARAENLTLRVVQSDVREFVRDAIAARSSDRSASATLSSDDDAQRRDSRGYDAIFAIGLYHFLPELDVAPLIAQMQTLTRPGGFHVAAWFTNQSTHPLSSVHLPPPARIAALYAQWRTIEHAYAWIEKGADDDGHPIRMHDEWLVTQRPV